jgi:hypothetical protein
MESAISAKKSAHRRSTQPRARRADNLGMTKSLGLAALLVTASLASAEPIADQEDPVIVSLKAAEWRRGILEANLQNSARSAALGEGAEATKVATRCSAAVRAKLGTGMAPDQVYMIDGITPIELGAIEARYCAPLEKLARTFDAAIATARGKRDSGIEARLVKVGLTGDKLRLARAWAHNDDVVYGIGGVELAPAQIAKSSVLFILHGDNEHDWTLVRFRFSGGTLVSRSVATYFLRPATSKFR